MGIRSHQIQPLSLCLHWRGQQCFVAGSQNVIGFSTRGELQTFLPTQTSYIDIDWYMLLSIERAHGWLSINSLKLPKGIFLNGRMLSEGPFLMKEAMLMMPPHSNDAIELFLSESLNDWESEIARKQLLKLELDDFEKSSKLAARYPQYSSDEQILARKIDDYSRCEVEYGIVDRHGKLIELKTSYNFGALRLEIEDDECWVFADDGVLTVNGQPCRTTQVFVGDQVQWQANHWFIVGQSVKQRAHEPAPQKQVALPLKMQLESEEDLFPGGTLAAPALLSKQETVFQGLTEAEMTEFRAKLAVWLNAQPASPEDVPPAAEDISSRRRGFSVAPHLTLSRPETKVSPQHKIQLKLRPNAEQQHQSAVKKSIFRHLNATTAITALVATSLAMGSFLVFVYLV